GVRTPHVAPRGRLAGAHRRGAAGLPLRAARAGPARPARLQSRHADLPRARGRLAHREVSPGPEALTARSAVWEGGSITPRVRNRDRARRAIDVATSANHLIRAKEHRGRDREA